MEKTIDVVLVDDHEVVRLGLITLLVDIPWVRVVAEAGTAAEAIQAVAQYQPDVVIMDIRLPGESGIEACRHITQQWTQTKVIMLTSYADDDLIFRALQNGASGYVLKQVGNSTLVNAMDAVRRGEALLDSVTTQRVIARVRQSEQEHDLIAFKNLSEREMGVLAMLTQGKSNGEIADKFSLSEKTVRNHISTILAKLHLTNRTEASAYGVRHQIQQHLKQDR